MKTAAPAPAQPPLAPTTDGKLRSERLVLRHAAHASDGPKLSEQARARALRTTTDLHAAREHIIAGELGPAEEALRRYLTQYPNDAAAWSLLGDCLRKASRWPEAVDAYRTVVRLGAGPEVDRARFLAASVLQDRLHDPRGVVALLDGFDASSLMAPEATVRLVRALIDLGEKKRAEALLRNVVEAHAPAHVMQEAKRLRSSLGASAP